MNDHLSRDDKAFIVAVVVVTTLIIALYYGFINSFEPATFQVTQREWSTTSELYHYETEIVCDDEGCEPVRNKVVDERHRFSGREDDPITYYTFIYVPYDHHTSYSFYSNVALIVNESRTITYHPSQTTYESLSRGMYCKGEIGWFNYVRRLNCSGR